MPSSSDWFFRLTTIENAEGVIVCDEDGCPISGLVTLYAQWYTPDFFHDRLSQMRLLVDGAEYVRQPDGRSWYNSFGVTIHMLRYHIDTRRLPDGPHQLTVADYGKSGQQIVRSESRAVVIANAPA